MRIAPPCGQQEGRSLGATPMRPPPPQKKRQIKNDGHGRQERYFLNRKRWRVGGVLRETLNAVHEEKGNSVDMPDAVVGEIGDEDVGTTNGVDRAYDMVSSRDEVELVDDNGENIWDEELVGMPQTTDVTSSTSVLQHLMGLWDTLSAQLKHVPGDPTVVVKAMKLALAHSEPEVLAKAFRLASRVADVKNPQVGILSCDVVAAAILASVFHSMKSFPMKLVRRKVSDEVAQIGLDVIKVSEMPSRVELYDDEAATAAKELCLTFYDIRATTIEIVSRLQDLEMLAHVSATGGKDLSLQNMALEALQLYAPLGHALGLNRESLELENLSLEILFPSFYMKTSEWLDSYVAVHDKILESARDKLKREVMMHPRFKEKAAGIVVKSRRKSTISTLKKLLRLGDLSKGGRSRNEVYDVLGLRVIVQPRDDLPEAEREDAAIEACYIVDSVSRNIWPIIESRSKDYIASPKPNGYASLHRTVVVDATDEVMVELQIRTQEMHERAESGDAAHGAYKGGLSLSQAQHLIELKTSQDVQESTLSTGIEAGEALFRSIDLNGDGEVTLDELALAIQDLGEEDMSGAYFLLREADTNKDGVISLEEFMEFQKLMGLSSALAELDQQYAESMSPAPGQESIPLKPAGDNSRISPLTNRNANHDRALHTWSSANTRFVRMHAFTEADDAGSSGSLDDASPISGARETKGGFRPSTRKDFTVITIEQEKNDEDKPITPDSRYLSRDSTVDLHEQDASSYPMGSRFEEESPSISDSTDSQFGKQWNLENAMHGFRRLFQKAGSDMEATWSLKILNGSQVTNAVGQSVLDVDTDSQIKISKHGPVILGAVGYKDCDLIIDVPTVSARHARLEIIRDRVQEISKCIIMDLGSTNGVWVNRTKIQPFKEVHLFPGDVICLAEPHICFQVIAGEEKVNKSQKTEVSRGLAIAESLEADAATMGVFAPKVEKDCDANQEAKKLISARKHQAAYMLLLGSVLSNPEFPGTWMQLAAMERQRSRRRKQKSSAATTRAFLRAAVERFEAEDEPEARRMGLSKAFKTWALLEFDMRNDGPARSLFQRALKCVDKLADEEKSKDERAKLLFAWASREWKLKDAPLAARLCKQALDAQPENPYALTLLGKLKEEIGDVPGARESFRLAVKSDKTHLAAIQSWARMEASVGRMSDARNLFRVALSVEPNNQYILQAWAVAERNAGNPGEARSKFKECTELHPTCRAAWHAWAKLEEDSGNLDQARELYLNVLDLKPTSRRTLSALGRLERIAGNLDAAEQLLRKALDIDGQHVASLMELSLTMKEKKKFSEAYALQKKANRINASQRSQLAQISYLKRISPE